MESASERSDGKCAWIVRPSANIPVWRKVTSRMATASQNPPGWPPESPVPAPASEDEQISAHARSACEQHRRWIEEQVCLGRNAISIYQDLVEQFAFEHKYNSVKRFCRALRRKDPVQYDRLEFPPGEEAQVDYGLGAPTRRPGKTTYRRPRLFVMTLKHSRRCFRKVVCNPAGTCQ